MSEQKDRPKLRAKIYRKLISLCDAVHLFASKDTLLPSKSIKIMNDQILALIPDTEQIDAMLVEARRTAKKQGVLELLNWLKEYAVHGSKMALEDVLIDIQAHSPYGQALGEK